MVDPHQRFSLSVTVNYPDREHAVEYTCRADRIRHHIRSIINCYHRNDATSITIILTKPRGTYPMTSTDYILSFHNKQFGIVTYIDNNLIKALMEVAHVLAATLVADISFDTPTGNVTLTSCRADLALMENIAALFHWYPHLAAVRVNFHYTFI